MAYQSLNYLWIPRPWAELQFGFTGSTMNASGSRVGIIFQIPKTGTLNRIGFRTGTVTAADTLRVSFQDVTAAGVPDGSIDQYRTVASGSVTSNTWITTGLITSDGTDTGTKRSVTRGNWMAVVIQFDSFVSGNLIIAGLDAAANRTGPGGGAYQCVDTGTGTFGAGSQTVIPVLALQYDDNTYSNIIHAYPLSTLTTQGVATNTTPDEAGMIFQLPFPCKISGAWFRADLDGTSDIVLYDSDGSTELASVTIDNDYRPSNTQYWYNVYFPSDVTLSANTNYRLVFQPTTTTSSALTFYTADSADVLAAIDGGSNFHWTERTDGGSWSQTTTKRPYMGLILSAFDDAVSAGGFFTPVGGGAII